jgi:hypothetical protein
VSLLIQIQDQNHDVVRQFSDGPDQGLLALARRMRDVSEVMRIIDPDTDTMLNRIQQSVLRDELDDLLAHATLPSSEDQVARDLLQAVVEAYDIGGYIMILGR